MNQTKKTKENHKYKKDHFITLHKIHSISSNIILNEIQKNGNKKRNFKIVLYSFFLKSHTEHTIPDFFSTKILPHSGHFSSIGLSQLAKSHFG